MASVSTIFGNFNEEQLKALKDALNEMGQCMQKMDTEKDIIKDIIDATHDNLKIPKRFLNVWLLFIIRIRSVNKW
jgi:hypothetical protein